jgi:hypothetical protein
MDNVIHSEIDSVGELLDFAQNQVRTG